MLLRPGAHEPGAVELTRPEANESLADIGSRVPEGCTLEPPKRPKPATSKPELLTLLNLTVRFISPIYLTTSLGYSVIQRPEGVMFQVKELAWGM